MKSFIFGLLFLSLTTLSWAQEKKSSVEERVDHLPEEVIESAGDYFSLYLPNKNQVITVRKVEDTFIQYRLGIDFEGYKNYMVFFKTKDDWLRANFNETGKLIITMERYGRTMMRREVIKTLNKKYPGWRVVNNHYLYLQEEGEVIKKEYIIILKKGNGIHKINGYILW